MHRFLALAIFGAFAAVAVFGLLAMNHTMQSHTGCIAAQEQGADCPWGISGVALIDLHAKFFQSMTLAVLFVVMILAVLWSSTGRSFAPVRSDSRITRPLSLDTPFGNYHANLISWLSRFELSPNIS